MRMRIAVVAVVLTGLLAACAAGASAAEPAFFECAKLKGGGFANKVCSEGAVAGKGKYQLVEGASKNAISGKVAEVTFLAEGIEFTCQRSVVTGDVASPGTLGDVVITLDACVDYPDRYCGRTVGHHQGTIVIGPLLGTLGYTDRETKSVGVQLRPESGETLAEFGCNSTGTPEYELHGSLLASLSGNVNTVTKLFALKLLPTGALEGAEPAAPSLQTIGASEDQPATLTSSPLNLKTKGEIEVKA